MEATTPTPAPVEAPAPAPLPRGRACAACGVARVVLARPKDGARLCKECFCAAFEADVHATIVRHGLFRPGERVAVAASGGKGEDSGEQCGGRHTAFPSLDAVTHHATSAAAAHTPVASPIHTHARSAPQTRRCWRTCSRRSTRATATGWTCSCCRWTRASRATATTAWTRCARTGASLGLRWGWGARATRGRALTQCALGRPRSLLLSQRHLRPAAGSSVVQAAVRLVHGRGRQSQR